MLDPRALFAKLYGTLHRYIYRKRLLRQTKFQHARIISIGNLSMGGTGKTPLTLALAEAALRHKLKPLVILRGYGVKRSTDPVLVSNGHEVLCNHTIAGDEAMLFADIPELQVAVGRDRAEVIRIFGQDRNFILLDDAFQNPGVARDHELVLIDSSIPVSKFHTFPLGTFREGLDALQRAHTIVLTRTDQAPAKQVQAWHSIIKSKYPDLKIFHGEHRPEPVKPDLITQDPVGIFSGIGNPESFKKTVQSLGYKIGEQMIFKDHYQFKPTDLHTIFDLHPELAWITTEKDAVRLSGFLENQPAWASRLHIMPVRMQLRETSIDGLLDRLTQYPIGSA